MDSDDEDNDTTASRFTAKLLNFLLKGFQAKDKVVRYRVISIAAEMISYLGELECVLIHCLWPSAKIHTTAKTSTRIFGPHCWIEFMTRKP